MNSNAYILYRRKYRPFRTTSQNLVRGAYCPVAAARPYASAFRMSVLSEYGAFSTQSFSAGRPVIDRERQRDRVCVCACVCVCVSVCVCVCV